MQDQTSTVTFEENIPKIKKSSSVSTIFSSVSGIKGANYHSNEMKFEDIEFPEHLK